LLHRRNGIVLAVVKLLGNGRLAAQVLASLGREPLGPIVVAFDLRLARALAARALDVVTLTDRPRDVERAPGRGVLWINGEVEVPVPDNAAAAVIAGAARRPGGPGEIAALAAALGNPARLVLVDRVSAIDASRSALLAGLSRLAQATVSRTVVTAGDWV
jgi:hypothetical protein